MPERNEEESEPSLSASWVEIINKMNLSSPPPCWHYESCIVIRNKVKLAQASGSSELNYSIWLSWESKHQHTSLTLVWFDSKGMFIRRIWYVRLEKSWTKPYWAGQKEYTQQTPVNSLWSTELACLNQEITLLQKGVIQGNEGGNEKEIHILYSLNPTSLERTLVFSGISENQISQFEYNLIPT